MTNIWSSLNEYTWKNQGWGPIPLTASGCADECWATSFPQKEGKDLIFVFANFCVVNTATMADFRLPMWSHWKSRKAAHNLHSWAGMNRWELSPLHRYFIIQLSALRYIDIDIKYIESFQQKRSWRSHSIAEKGKITKTDAGHGHMSTIQETGHLAIGCEYFHIRRPHHLPCKINVWSYFGSSAIKSQLI